MTISVLLDGYSYLSGCTDVSIHLMKMEEKTYTIDKILKSDEFKNFEISAKKYCEFIEQNYDLSLIDFLNESKQKLNNLYNRADKMLWVDLNSNLEYDEKLGDLTIIKDSIAKRLDENRYYWHLFNPIDENDQELICGDLLDDLIDIYKDLKYSDLIFNLNKPDCKENALWQYKFDFDMHWSDHCINAMYAIHFFIKNRK